MDWQIAFNLAFGVMCGAIGFVVSQLRDELRTLRETFKDYVPRKEYEAANKALNDWLARIDAKLDDIIARVK